MLNLDGNLMVVACVLAFKAFWAGVNPPGGVWKDNKDGHIAGSSVLATANEDAYALFTMFNTTCLMASLSSILLLHSGLPFNNRVFMWILRVILSIAIIAMGLAYLVCFTHFNSKIVRLVILL